jgi:hypothetical protein
MSIDQSRHQNLSATLDLGSMLAGGWGDRLAGDALDRAVSDQDIGAG